MPDYKQMYLIMIQASEEAINLLIKAQQECEELYLSAREPELTLLAPSRAPPRYGAGFFLNRGPTRGLFF